MYVCVCIYVYNCVYIYTHLHIINYTSLNFHTLSIPMQQVPRLRNRILSSFPQALLCSWLLMVVLTAFCSLYKWIVQHILFSVGFFTLSIVWFIHIVYSCRLFIHIIYYGWLLILLFHLFMFSRVSYNEYVFYNQKKIVLVFLKRQRQVYL